MFNQLLAIDVLEHIPEHEAQLGALCTNDLISARNCAEALSMDLSQSSVDGLLISIHESVSEEFLQRFENVRYVGILGTSTKKIPLDYCQARGITVANVTGYCDDDTAEWVMWKILEFFRTQPSPRNLVNKKLGIVGAGSVGKKLMEMARAFSMEIYWNAPGAHAELERSQFLSKERMLETCDVVSVHTPPFLSWLDASLLNHARQNLLLVNTAMGRISPHNDLEDFLGRRSDVQVIMDHIAGNSYLNLAHRARIASESAYSTLDSQENLVNKFMANVRGFAQ